jgi:hypothetical protein
VDVHQQHHHWTYSRRGNSFLLAVMRLIELISIWLLILAIMVLMLSACGPRVVVPSDTPPPYHLSTCTQQYMEQQHANKLLPKCVALDWKEVTDLNLQLEARRKMEKH